VRLRFLWIGKTKDLQLAELEQKYLKRISHYFPAEVCVAPELKKERPAQAIAQFDREAKSVARRIGASDYVIVLDQRGREFSSEEMAAFFESLASRAMGQVTFVVGGHLGVPEQIRRMAQFTWSLTRLTLPHEIARVVLLEQVYRSISIIRNLPYHK